MHRPSRDQILTVLSRDAETSREPSGEYAQACTPVKGPVAGHVPFERDVLIQTPDLVTGRPVPLPKRPVEGDGERACAVGRARAREHGAGVRLSAWGIGLEVHAPLADQATRGRRNDA
jgi:hypothetical protein